MADRTSPPVAPRRPTIVQRGGHDVTDDYAWMRQHDDPELLAYLKAENEYCDTWFAPLADLQEQLFQEIKARVQEDDRSVPVPKGRWEYYSRTAEGQQYAYLCRRPRGGGDEHILVDQNALAEGQSYFALGAYDASPSQRLLAYSVDLDGDEIFQLRIRDLETGNDLADVIDDTVYGTAWSSDERHLFYTKADDAWRPYQVWRHEIGTEAAADVLVFQEDDDRFWLDLENDRSGDWIVLSLGSRTSSEAWLLASADALGTFRCVEPRRPDIDYAVEPQGRRLLVLTNDDALDFRVCEAPIDAPGRSNWKDLVPHRPGHRVHGIDGFERHVVIYEWHDALPRLLVLTDDDRRFVLDQPEAVHTVAPGANAEFTTDVYRLSYASPLTSPCTVEVDVRSGERTILKQEPVLGGYDPALYETRREWAVAPDGTKVPLSIVHRRGLALDGTNPCLLYGYGSYEATIPASFSWIRLNLLERGFVFVIAHIRGGGEMGRTWWNEGKLLTKRNTFTDFIASAEHLIARGYTSTPRLACHGGSAGGLLVGAAMAMRPDLFGAVVAEVPFVDVVGSMHDETLPLTIVEWDEWGNPKNPEYDAYITSYSPYENVRDVDYPALYVSSGLSDPRVGVHEPAKWVARIRATAGDTMTRPLVFHLEMVGGHAGPTGRYDAWRDDARVQAFVLRALGVV